MNVSLAAVCCFLGAKCDDSPCSTNRFFGFTTITETVTTSSTSFVSTVTESACLGRKCLGSSYECPSSLGGGCCGYGSDCVSLAGATTAGCVGTVSTPSTSASALLTPIPSGCSVQGQTFCTAAGAGCCDAGFSCTSITSSGFNCVSSTATSTLIIPTGSGITVVHDKPTGLSTGAKAGIAVGVILAVLLIVSALAWLCLRRRRQTARSVVTAQELQSNPPIFAAGAIGPASDDGGIRPYDAQSGPRHMSEVDGFSYGYAPSSTHGGDASMYDQQGAAVEIGTRGNSMRRPVRHTRMSSHASDGDGSQSELADTEVERAMPARRVSARSGGGTGGGMRDSIAEVFELPGNYVVLPPSAGAGGESEKEVFHDAPEMRGGSATGLPLPTPGSDRSEYVTPSPMEHPEYVKH